MTSANRSSEPIAYQDDDALQQLSGIADGFLIGERPIARRVDDSVARAGVFGPTILRRARGYAPGAVATFPTGPPDSRPGRGSKEHDHAGCGWPGIRQPAYRRPGPLRIVLRFPRNHPGFAFACMKSIRVNCCSFTMRILNMFRRFMPRNFPHRNRYAVQHHRAHIASVLAERGAWDKRVHRGQFRWDWLRGRRHDLGRRNFRGKRTGGLRARRASARRLICPAAMRPLRVPSRLRRVFLRNSMGCQI